MIKGKYAISAALLLASATAFAQSTSQATVGGASQNANADAIQEITVTAQKTSEAINKVPISISAATGEQLATIGVTDTRDLAKLTPGFTFADTQLGIPVYTLRGIGFYDQSVSSTPAVSVYNDEVPLTFPEETRGAILDLERVEVLKGPQGTLFGQNATGGAINYIAAKPTDQLAYGFDAGFGRFDEINLGGFVSGPLTDTLRVRVAAQTTQREDGWQESYTRSDTLGRANKTLWRTILDWTPNDRLSVRLNVNGWDDRSDTGGAQLVGILPQNPAHEPPAYANYPLAPANDQAADWGNNWFEPGHPKRDQQFSQTSLRLDYKLNDDLTLTSLSAYNNLHGHSVFSAAGVEPDAFTYINIEQIQSEYQEVRIAGTASPFKWVVGANYEHDDTNQDTPFDVGFASNATPAPGFIIDEAGLRSTTTTDTYAGFGNLEYSIASNVTLQGAVRYTEDDHRGTDCGFTGPDDGTGKFFDLLVSELSGGMGSANIPPGGCYTLGPPPYFPPELVTQTLDEHNVSWRTGVNWNVTDDLLAYANISRGYKNGGFPGLSATTYVALTPYKQETVLAYETGFKATLADHRVQLNSALFYYDYSDKQILGNYEDPVFGIQPTIVNIPKSRIIGIEGQLEARPIDGLRLSLSGTYLDSEIQEYQGYNTLAQVGNYAGTVLPFTPKFSAAADVEYDWQLTPALKGFVGSGGTFNSRSNAGVGDIPLLNIDPYGILDLRAGVRTADDRWTITAYGNNVTDKYYWTTVLHVQDGIIRYAGMPVTYGVKVNYRY